MINQTRSSCHHKTFVSSGVLLFFILTLNSIPEILRVPSFNDIQAEPPSNHFAITHINIIPKDKAHTANTGTIAKPINSLKFILLNCEFHQIFSFHIKYSRPNIGQNIINNHT
ncbi:MAG: hypothetical protein LBU14_03705 [Candidatus Peribacteria bacterium]|jgi:hypothetical protein|nr:hypothetical protein [Candidatus Peribacteria bacterium]